MRNSTVRVATFAGPGAEPVIRSVPWPQVPKNAALIQIGACGVCGTDLHILKGHWPKPLPWPFTLGHELGGVIVEKGGEFTEDFMGKTLGIGSKVMIPPLMPCGQCYYCVHYPEHANKCLTPVYYGRYLDLDMLPGTKVYKLPDDMPLRLGALSEPLTSCIRAFNRAARAGGFTWGDTVVIQGSGPIGILAIAAREMGAARVICVGAPEAPRLELARKFGAEATVNIERGQGSGRAHRARARHRRRLWRRPGDGLFRPSERRSRGHRDATRRRHLCGDGPVHRCRLDRHVLAPHLRQGPQRAGLVGLHRQRLAARRRHARPRPRQISLARHADALPLRR